MQSNPTVKELLDMGFGPILSKAAVLNLKTKDTSALLDWISDHEGQEEKWSKWLQENKGNEGVAIKEGAAQSITHLINKQFSEVLQGKGHSKAVAQKSLLLTNNASVQSAEAWIQQHKYDADFQEQLLLQGQAFEQSNMTEEEAKQKLKELTEIAREKRKKREEEEERERERNRMRYGKEMIEAKRIAEEQALKRDLELGKIEKQRDAEYKQKLLEQMRKQKNERMGIKEDPASTAPSTKKVEKPQLSMLEQLEVQCEQVKVGMHAYPDRAQTFFETAQIYVNNIIKNKGEEKFRKINMENKAFQGRIMDCFGGVETLQVLGYEENNKFLVMNKYDLSELQKASQILGRYKQQY